MQLPYSNSSIAVDNVRLIDCFPGNNYLYLAVLFHSGKYRSSLLVCTIFCVYTKNIGHFFIQYTRILLQTKQVESYTLFRRKPLRFPANPIPNKQYKHSVTIKKNTAGSPKFSESLTRHNLNKWKGWANTVVHLRMEKQMYLVCRINTGRDGLHGGHVPLQQWFMFKQNTCLRPDKGLRRRRRWGAWLL